MVIAGDESCAERRRTENFPVEHAGAFHVRRVSMRAGDKVAAVHFRTDFRRRSTRSAE